MGSRWETVVGKTLKGLCMRSEQRSEWSQGKDHTEIGSGSRAQRLEVPGALGSGLQVQGLKVTGALGMEARC